MKNWRWLLVGIVAVLVLLFAAVQWYLLYTPADPVSAPPVAETITAQEVHTMGNPKAKVTLIEYAALTCPTCAFVATHVMPDFKKRYIDTGKVFYVFRQFPIRPDDGAAEKIARCLPEDKYFPFIDLLWRNQPLWDVEFGVTDVHGGLVRLGRMAGLSADQVDKCIDNKAEDDRINKQTADAESRYNVTGTPTFILNGTSIGSGNLPISDMSKTIDAALAPKK